MEKLSIRISGKNSHAAQGVRDVARYCNGCEDLD